MTTERYHVQSPAPVARCTGWLGIVLASALFAACGGSDAEPDGGRDGAIDAHGDSAQEAGRPAQCRSDAGPSRDASLTDAGRDSSAPTQVAAGENFTCAQLASAGASCWGTNTERQLGQPVAVIDKLQPALVPGVAGLTKLALGGRHVCVLREGGEVVCWGRNAEGQLGRGAGTSPDATPQRVGCLGAVTQLSAGGAHTCAVGADHRVFCWGSNEFGQLGDGTSDRDSHGVPAPVAQLTEAQEVAAGVTHTCARKSDGSVACWGGNKYGQCARASTQAQLNAASAVAGLANVSQLALGGFHACARKTDGTVWCWGRNDAGQLGDGTTTSRATPAVVPALTGVAEVRAGLAHTCARKTDGTVLCWGANQSGQAAGTGGTQRSPVAVAGLTGIVEIAAGATHNCARDDRAQLWCWGSNVNGALGIGTRANTARPQLVRFP